MRRVISLLAFSGTFAVAAPPISGPGVLTTQQIIAHRQGVDIEARRSAAETIAGSRADEFTPFNPGSSLARFLFNATVINSIPQNVGQPGFPTGINLSSSYIDLIEKGTANNVDLTTHQNPFGSKIEKSQIQGLIFLNPSKLDVPIGLIQQQKYNSVSEAYK